MVAGRSSSWLLAITLVGCAAEPLPPPAPPPPPPPLAPPPPPPPPPPAPVVILERIEFDKGSPVIRDTDFARLGRIAEVLKQSPHVRMVELHGHTDDGGDADPNLVLSQQRAEAVRAYLVNQGVEGTRLRSRAFGKTIPIAPNATPAGRAQNRRVEFRIVEQ